MVAPVRREADAQGMSEVVAPGMGEVVARWAEEAAAEEASQARAEAEAVFVGARRLLGGSNEWRKLARAVEVSIGSRADAAAFLHGDEVRKTDWGSTKKVLCQESNLRPIVLMPDAEPLLLVIL